MDIKMEKIDRIEQHLKILQQESKATAEINRQILSCLIGDSVNGNSGLVHRVKDVDNRLKQAEKEIQEHTFTILLLKFVTGVVFIGLFGMILKLIFKV